MPVPSAPSAVLLHDHQHRARVDRLTFADRNVFHAAIARGAQLVFHFHGFDDDEALAGRHLIAGFYEDAHDLARHRRRDALRTGGRSARALLLLTPERTS